MNIPIDFSQVSQWLLMPATLALIANLVITNFLSKATPKAQSFARLSTFVVIGIVSFLLTKLSPDFIVSIEPLWAAIATAITAYYATNFTALVGLRLAVGKEGAKFAYDKLNAHG